MTNPSPNSAHAAFSALCAAVSNLPEEHQQSLRVFLATLACNLDQYARETDQKVAINRVLFALAAKHWKGYTSLDATQARREAAGEQMHKLILELEQEAKGHPLRLTGSERCDFKAALKQILGT